MTQVTLTITQVTNLPYIVDEFIRQEIVTDMLCVGTFCKTVEVIFSLLFLAVWVWTLFLLFLPQVCFFAAAEPEFSLRGKSNLKSKRLKITSFEPKSRSVISRYDVAAVRKEAFHSPSFLILVKSQAVNFLTRTKIVQFKSKTGIKGLAVNIQEDCPIQSKNWDQKSTFDTEENCPFQSNNDWNKKLSTIYTE